MPSQHFGISNIMSNREDDRSIQESSLYLVEDRLKTFESSRWPFDSGPCTAVKASSLCTGVDPELHCYIL